MLAVWKKWLRNKSSELDLVLELTGEMDNLLMMHQINAI